MTVLEKIREVDLDARSRELRAALDEAEASLESAAKRALFGEISDAELQPFQTKVAAIKSKLDGLDAAKAEKTQLEQAEERERQRAASRKAAEEIGRLAPLLSKELRAVLKGLATADRHAKEYDRISAEIRRIAKPFDALLSERERVSGFGHEGRLVYQALESSHLRTWGFEEIASVDAAVRARAIGDARDWSVTLDQVVRDGTKQIEEMLAAMTGDD